MDSMKKEHPPLSEQAIKIPFPFSTAYLYEAGFSLSPSTRATYWNRLNAEAKLRFQLFSSTLLHRKDLQKNVKFFMLNFLQVVPSHKRPSDFTFLISDTRIYRTTLETATAKFH